MDKIKKFPKSIFRFSFDAFENSPGHQRVYILIYLEIQSYYVMEKYFKKTFDSRSYNNEKSRKKSRRMAQNKRRKIAKLATFFFLLHSANELFFLSFYPLPLSLYPSSPLSLSFPPSPFPSPLSSLPLPFLLLITSTQRGVHTV